MYESFYGLTGKPFQLNPDPSFYYGSRGHKRAFAYLEYGLYQSEGFIVITGEIGAGKTTIVRSLLEQLDPREGRRGAARQHAARRRRHAARGRRGVRAAGQVGRQGRSCSRRWRRSCASSRWTRSARCWSSTRRRT